MKRYLIDVAYDGTDYCGFQYQPGVRTIEGSIQEALEKIFGKVVPTYGGSRTDSGVHALQNVLCFDAETSIPAERLPWVLNDRLPMDIRVRSCREVADDFHPRHCDTRKTYSYLIETGSFANPLMRRYCWHVSYKLDVSAMNEAAQVLTGEHDFTSFCTVGAQAESMVRTIYSIGLKRSGDNITLTVCGAGFLYNMVRIIAGTLVEMGRGRWPAAHMTSILEACDRRAAGPTAPAQGLCLTRYEFDYGIA